MSIHNEPRTLGPEMKAEGSIPIGDWLWWFHTPSHRVVCIDAYKWGQTSGIPAVPEEPSDPETDGWVVGCRECDELGNPLRGHALWVASYAEAIRRGRRWRQSILDEHQPKRYVEQLTLDDALEHAATQHKTEGDLR